MYYQIKLHNVDYFSDNMLDSLVRHVVTGNYSKVKFLLIFHNKSQHLWILLSTGSGHVASPPFNFKLLMSLISTKILNLVLSSLITVSK